MTHINGVITENWFNLFVSTEHFGDLKPDILMIYFMGEYHHLTQRQAGRQVLGHGMGQGPTEVWLEVGVIINGEILVKRFNKGDKVVVRVKSNNEIINTQTPFA